MTENTLPSIYTNPDAFIFEDTAEDDLKLFSSRRRRPAMEIIYARAAEIVNTENVSATIDGLGPATFMIDSGATYTILPSSTADSIGFDVSNRTPIRQQAVTTVTGQTQANVYSVQLKLNDTPAFQTEILVM